MTPEQIAARVIERNQASWPEAFDLAIAVRSLTEQLAESRRLHTEMINKVSAGNERISKMIEEVTANTDRLKTNQRTPGTVEVCALCYSLPRGDGKCNDSDGLGDYRQQHGMCPMRQNVSCETSLGSVVDVRLHTADT